MPITVRVHGAAGAPVTHDSPRVLIGRSEGCDVRLPDSSVSHRHASIRQRGSEYVLVDEGSTNGTRIGKTALSAHASHTLSPREVIRVGKVWLELVVCSEPPSRNAPQRAREIALDLVCAALDKAGEDGRPRVTVESGPAAGTETRVPLGGATLSLGRSREADLALADPDLSRMHAELRHVGDVLVVRDLGSKTGTMIGERNVLATDVVWKRGELLRVGGSTLVYDFAAAEALAELERMPDARVPLGELLIGDDAGSSDEVDDASVEDSEADPERDDDGAEPHDASEAPYHGDTSIAAANQRSAEAAAARRGPWSLTDLAVVLLALGVFSLSAVGYVVLLR